MKKSIIFINTLLVLLGTVLGCKKNDAQPDLDLDADVSIKSFTVNDISGVIVDSTATIYLTFPYGSDISAVSPQVTIAGGATVAPASGATVDLRNSVTYTVTNGNIYNKYTVVATIQPAILYFIVEGDTAVINEQTHAISATVPKSSSLSALSPTIVMAEGATIAPQSGVQQDFSNPVIYTVSANSLSVDYTVTVVRANSQLAFLGTAASYNDITNGDEKAAVDWLLGQYDNASYLSMEDIEAGTVNLNQYGVIWWHEDATQTLPSIAYEASVITALQAYRANGGALFLSSFGAQYVEALGIVPSGKNPNNTFGDSYGSQWIEASWDWGISFKTTSTHPIFEGLTLTSEKDDPTAYLLAKGTYRLNHTAMWKVNEWGGYGTIADWSSATGLTPLGSTEWDPDMANHVTVAEAVKTANAGGVVIVGAGCYDWFNEPDPSTGAASAANDFHSNIERLTQNIINYLNQ
ncbi:MAG: DUF4960 domain-containing protein [Edaphocola sp.]